MICLRSSNRKAVTRLSAIVCSAVLLVETVSINKTQAHDASPKAENVFLEAGNLRGEQREDSNLKAIDKYREAAALWRASGQLQQAAVALRNAGEILHLLGKTAGAKESLNEALTLSKSVKDQLEEARVRNDLSYLYFIDGDNKNAGEHCLIALKIAKTFNDRAIEAEALSNLGETFYNRGDLGKAHENQQQSLAIWRELNNQRGQAIALTALTYYYANLGEPARALDSGIEALSLAKSANDLRVEGLALVALGNSKRKFGEKQEALTAYHSAKIIAERIGDKTSRAILTAGIGSVSLEMGDEEKALEFMEEAMRQFEINGQKWGAAEVKMSIGQILEARGDGEKALAVLSEALALLRSLSMRRLESLTLRSMGLVSTARGDHNGALRMFQQALALINIENDQRLASYLLNYIGKCHENLKKPAEAERYYRRALTLSRNSSDPESETLSFYNLARLERDRNNLAEASRNAKSAIAITESMRMKVSSKDLRTSYFATIRNTYELYIDILMRLHKQDRAAGFDQEAFAVSERARARTFLELLSEARANIREGVDPALLSKESELNTAVNAKAQYQHQLLANKQKEEAARVGKEVDALVADLARVRDEIRVTSPRYAALIQPEFLDVRQVQQQVIDDDTILLEYALGDDRSYVWVVTRDGFESYELPSRGEIEAAAKRLYNLFTLYQMVYGESASARAERRAKADAAMPQEIATLSKLVLGPLAGKLEKKKLLVIADGALQYIPFQLLKTHGAESRLIDAHVIAYSFSASTAAVLKAEATNRQPARNSVAVLADPVFEADDPRIKNSSQTSVDHLANTTEVRQTLRDVGISPDGIEIPRLLASGLEADGIIASAPWRSGLKAVGFAANRDRVLGPELATYRIVHFATHGVINSERPELSGIVLSLFDSEGRSQNGFLRLHDIYNLRLPADLVVLSACSTGLGKDVKGEGLIGLTRGFMYAGASRVVASLWKVDDDATAELMKHFYEAMFQRGMAPALALREAQLRLSQQKRWQSPYYWAGFVLQGQYTENTEFVSPFPNKTQIAWLGTLSGVFLLALFFVIRRRRRQHFSLPPRPLKQGS